MKNYFKGLQKQIKISFISGFTSLPCDPLPSVFVFFKDYDLKNTSENMRIKNPTEDKTITVSEDDLDWNK